AREVRPAGPTLADWEKALAPLAADGGTSCGAALVRLAEAKRRIEQVVLVTDEGDNTAPLFKDGYSAYAKELGVRPGVIVVRVGWACEIVQQACRTLGVAPQVLTFTGDYYSLPNVIPLLTQPTREELLLEIMEYPLPAR